MADDEDEDYLTMMRKSASDADDDIEILEEKDESIPIIFVVGPLNSGKTKYIEDLSIETLPLPVLKRLETKPDKLVKIPFEVKELSELFMLRGANLISKAELTYFCAKHIIDKIVDASIEKQLIIVEHNPLYMEAEYDDINKLVRLGPQPNGKFIKALIDANIYPLCTIKLIPAKLMDTPNYTSPDCQYIRFTNTELREHYLKHELIYSIPCKNTGPMVSIKNGKIIRAFGTKNDARLVSPGIKVITSYDGLIGSGKSTILKIVSAHVPVSEPMEPIEELLAREFPDKIRQEVIELAVSRLMLRRLRTSATNNPEMNKFAIERNIAYSNWIFNANDDTEPIPDMNVVNKLAELGYNFGITYYIDMTIDTAFDRMKTRGRACDEKWTKEVFETMKKKLDILYKSPYDWPFAQAYVLTNDTKTSAPSPQYVVATYEPKVEDVIS